MHASMTFSNLVFQEVLIYHQWPGMTADLRCLAYIGYIEDNEILMYWTIDSVYADEYQEFNESWK